MTRKIKHELHNDFSPPLSQDNAQTRVTQAKKGNTDQDRSKALAMVTNEELANATEATLLGLILSLALFKHPEIDPKKELADYIGKSTMHVYSILKGETFLGVEWWLWIERHYNTDLFSRWVELKRERI